MKKPTIKSLRRKLKKIFSEYIRRRDATIAGECGFCITCGQPIRWKDAHAGHFVEVGTSTQGTEFDERNVHLQCCSCNTFHEGKKASYSIAMMDKYGPDIIKKLVVQSKWSLVRFVNWLVFKADADTTVDAYRVLITYYQENLEKLRSKK